MHHTHTIQRVCVVFFCVHYIYASFVRMWWTYYLHISCTHVV